MYYIIWKKKIMERVRLKSFIIYIRKIIIQGSVQHTTRLTRAHKISNVKRTKRILNTNVDQYQAEENKGNSKNAVILVRVRYVGSTLVLWRAGVCFFGCCRQGSIYRVWQRLLLEDFVWTWSWSAPVTMSWWLPKQVRACKCSTAMLWKLPQRVYAHEVAT